MQRIHLFGVRAEVRETLRPLTAGVAAVSRLQGIISDYVETVATAGLALGVG